MFLASAVNDASVEENRRDGLWALPGGAGSGRFCWSKKYGILNFGGREVLPAGHQEWETLKRSS